MLTVCRRLLSCSASSDFPTPVAPTTATTRGGGTVVVMGGAADAAVVVVAVVVAGGNAVSRGRPVGGSVGGAEQCLRSSSVNSAAPQPVTTFPGIRHRRATARATAADGAETARYTINTAPRGVSNHSLPPLLPRCRRPRRRPQDGGRSRWALTVDEAAALSAASSPVPSPPFQLRSLGGCYCVQQPRQDRSAHR